MAQVTQGWALLDKTGGRRFNNNLLGHES